MPPPGLTYATVEKRDRPELAEQPVIVGGRQRGVVLACCYVARLYGVRDVVLPALMRVGLSRQREFPCRYLSAGQRKRLGLARLLLSGRAVWLLDEPFAALDSAGRALAAELMTAHCASGGIVIAATHDPLGLDARSLRLEAA